MTRAREKICIYKGLAVGKSEGMRQLARSALRWENSAKIYTGCNRRNGPDFGRVFLRSNYTDITQNTYIQSSMVTEILAREV